ncbi:MAG: rRNA maturation RNase YbeY [bacterium]
MKLQVQVHNTVANKLNLLEIENIAKKVWLSEGKVDGHIEIILVNDEYIRNLNKEYLKKNSATDVIAFPLSEENEKSFEGEIYISLDTVKEQAIRYNVNLEEELLRMVIHGMLHFLGYDDKTTQNKKTMTNLENYFLSKHSKE